MNNQVQDVSRWLREYSLRHGIETPEKARAALSAFGMFGLEVPAQYGGLGLSQTDARRVLAQLGAIDLSLCISVIISDNVTHALLRYGSPQHKEGLLTRIVSGQLRASFSLSEPDAGSNLRGIQAYAEPTEGGFYLSGEKAWCGGAATADLILILARMEKDGPLTTFLADRNSPGITVHPAHPLIGLPGVSVNDLSLRRVFVPRERLLGQVGQGFTVAEEALNHARLAVCAVSVGAMKRALQWAHRYASRRQIGTGRMLENPIVLRSMEESAQAVVAVDALLKKVCMAIDRGQDVPVSARLACKVAGTEWLGQIADRLVQWLGARGYHARYPAGRLYQDYRLLRIGEGPTEALLTHMGALYAADSSGLSIFISETMNAPEVSALLASLCAAFDTQRHPQTSYYATGALIVEALMWAASVGTSAASWCARRLRTLHHRLMEEAIPGPTCDLSATLSAFNEQIGGLAETVPGAYRVDDPYLSDDGKPSQKTLSAQELLRLESFERGDAPPQPEGHVHHLFDRMVTKHPKAPAVYSDEEVLSYEELNARAEGLAGTLQQRGVIPGSLVPMLLRRTQRHPVAVLGVIKAGGILVPLDPVSPPERLQRILENMPFPVAITESSLQERLKPYPTLDVDGPPQGRFTPVRFALEAPALIIHTSGSTGRPKPVVLTHGGLANMLLCRQQLSPLDGSDKMLQCASPVFDISFWEVFSPLIAGGCLVTPARARTEWDGAEVAARIRALGVTTLLIVPTQLTDLLNQAGPNDLVSVRRIFCGGEALTRELATRVMRSTGATLYNVYGPTEATIECTWYRCRTEDSGNMPPIGRPLPGRRIYVLDEERRRVPLGEPGELHIGGVGVALGYWGDEASTKRVFLEDPFSEIPGARMYKTGDLGRFREDGNLEFLGRVDRQIKIRGVRIEPGEIEQVLQEHPLISHAVVRTADRGADGKVLVAYASLRPQSSLREEALLEHARQRLPRALVPAAIMLLPELPRTPTGKVDLNALPPIVWGSSRDKVATGANPTEQALIELCSSILGNARIGLDDDFFAIGGHSLTAAQLIAEVREHFFCQIRLNDFFANATLRWLALAVDVAAAAEARDVQTREVLLSLYDAARNREVPALVYLPEGEGTHPVILFSHGLGGTREGYAYLGRYWASQGYASVHLQHAGSDIDVLVQAKNPMLSAMQVTADRNHLMQRPVDVSFVLSQLERLANVHPSLRGRLDLSRVGAAGHSFGAFTALATAGLTILPEAGERRRFMDSRIKAVVALCPPALFGGALDAESYGGVERPCLHMSGTQDNGPVFSITPEERRFSYTHTPPGDQYMVMIEAAHHFTFGDNARWNGEKVQRDPKHHEYIQRLSTAFWDAFLREDGEARRWLRETAPQWLGASATFEYK
jgi:amino acid adenylation domain-containing protein